MTFLTSSVPQRQGRGQGRQGEGEMSPKNKEDIPQQWRCAQNKEESDKRINGDNFEPDAEELILSDKSECKNNLNRSRQRPDEDIESVRKPLETLNINVDEPAKKAEELPATGQEIHDAKNSKSPEESTEKSENRTSSEVHELQETSDDVPKSSNTNGKKEKREELDEKKTEVRESSEEKPAITSKTIIDSTSSKESVARTEKGCNLKSNVSVKGILPKTLRSGESDNPTKHEVGSDSEAAEAVAAIIEGFRKRLNISRLKARGPPATPCEQDLDLLYLQANFILTEGEELQDLGDIGEILENEFCSIPSPPDNSGSGGSGANSPSIGEYSPPMAYCPLPPHSRKNAILYSQSLSVESSPAPSASPFSYQGSAPWSPYPQSVTSPSSSGSPLHDHDSSHIAEINEAMSVVTYKNQEYHKYMRGRCSLPIRCLGYSVLGDTKEPALIEYLKEAYQGTPKYQKIYESARCYLEGHLALMYEEDSRRKTALYYAARIYNDDKIIGFIVECLLEAEQRCKLIPDPSKTMYKIEDEKYGENDNNILHCLAEWHDSVTNYIPVVDTLYKVCPSLFKTLLLQQNRLGQLPRDVSRGDIGHFLSSLTAGRM